MYNNEDYASDYKVAENMQAEFEELLVSHDVDLVLAGHYHSYLRTSRIYKDKADDDKGIYHFTVGSAGASLDGAELIPKDWVETYSLEFGIGKITVVNSTHMHWEFIENKVRSVKRIKYCAFSVGASRSKSTATTLHEASPPLRRVKRSEATMLHKQLLLGGFFTRRSVLHEQLLIFSSLRLSLSLSRRRTTMTRAPSRTPRGLSREVKER